MAAANQGRLLTRRGKNKKKSTLDTDRSRIEAHIKPLLGPRKVEEICRLDVEKFMHDVARGKTKRRLHTGKPRAVSHIRGGRGAATRTSGISGAIFSYGMRLGICSQNPVLGVTRFADGKRDRRLSDDEYKQLGGQGAAAVDGVRPYAISAALFLALYRLANWRSAHTTVA